MQRARLRSNAELRNGEHNFIGCTCSEGFMTEEMVLAILFGDTSARSQSVRKNGYNLDEVSDRRWKT